MKAIIKNYLSDIIPEFIMIFLNLILLKLFYSNLGTDIYALNQLFSQFFAYLLLAEAGFSSCALVSLYKPISEKNIDDLNRKLSGIRCIFKIIGIIILIVGIIISFVIPYTIKDNQFSTNYIQITFILFIIANSLNYFFFTYRVYYDANQKKYVPNLIYQIGSIIKYVVEIIALIIGVSFEILLILCILCNLLTNLYMRSYALKNNKNIKFTKEKDLSMLSNVKNLIVHKVSGVIANNIDILLISKYLGLTSVAMYSAYNYILNELTKFSSKVGTSLYSTIGVKHFNTGKKIKDTKNKNYINLNSFMFYVATVICSTLIFSYSSFISLFYGKEMVLKNLVTYLFIMLIFFQIIRVPLNSYVNGCGLFKETKICTITEGIINFILSFIWIKPYGMAGVLIATIISYIIADFIIKPIVVKKHLKLFTLKSFFCEIFKNIFCMVILLILNSYFMNVKVNSLISWFFISAVIFISNAILALIYFKVINRNQWFVKIIGSIRGEKNEV